MQALLRRFGLEVRNLFMANHNMKITAYYVLAPVKGDASGGFTEEAKFFNESDAIAHLPRWPGAKIEAREEHAHLQHEAHQATKSTVSAWGQPLGK